MKKMFLLAMLSVCLTFCAANPAAADVEVYDRIVFDRISTMNFDGSQIVFNLLGTADGEEASINGTYNDSGFSYHTANFKKVQTYMFRRGIIKKIIFYYEDLTE